MPRSSILIALISLTALAVSADPLITTTQYQSSCTAYGASTVTGKSACFSNPTGLANSFNMPEFGISYAAASASITTSLGGTSYSDIHAVQTIQLGEAWAQADTYPAPASATSTAQLSTNLTTAGPVRDGLLQIVFTNRSLGYPSAGAGWGTFSLSLNAGLESSLGCGISWSTCNATSVAEHYNALGGLIVPLGTAFSLNYNGIFNAFAGGTAEGNGSGTVDLDYQFRFLEADGITPVAVLSAAPEPTSFGLLGISLAATAFCKRRRA